jgi:dTDP-glucose pyrophosphorylase
MTDLSKYSIDQNATVRQAIEAVEKGAKKAIFILDGYGCLLGLFSDGDMRKYILANGDLNAPISAAMNPAPFVFRTDEERNHAMKQTRRVVYPLVDAENHLIDAIFWNDILEKNVSRSLKDIPVVIMAGGNGSRLRPYTNILPKALIPIGDITITERIINQFLNYECNGYYLILNHKKNMVKAYFNEVEKRYSLEYVDEETPLGTGGGVGLLRGKIQTEFFVSNCDILIEMDFGYLYDYHRKKNNIATIVCALKNVEMPYGVISLDDCEQVVNIAEKPMHSFLTNTGLYLFEPDIFSYIGTDETIDMTDVIMRAANDGRRVGMFPVSERAWLDMGQINEMETMLSALGEA